MDVASILELQASLLFFLGCVVLLAHQTSRALETGVGSRWFFGASVSGAIGLMLQSHRGVWPSFWTVVVGNLLFLVLIVCLTRSIALVTQSSARLVPYLLGIALAVACMLAYYTFAEPNVTRRVLIVSVVLPVMLTPAVWMLLRSEQRAIRVATRSLAGMILVFNLGCLMGAIAILQGARPTSGASWGGAVLIAGVALCFLWMDMLRLRAELETQALTDPLTGLLNRRAVEMMGERELSRAVRHGFAVTLLTVDVDHFKSINDHYGHQIGDAALVNVAAVLKRNVRAHDLAVRNGGDEFVILLTQSSYQIAQRIRERMQSEIEALQLPTHDGRSVSFSVTIGSFTMLPDARKTYADLVHASDMDLYLKKQQRHLGSEERALRTLPELRLPTAASPQQLA